jgi:hypothetical protein
LRTCVYIAPQQPVQRANSELMIRSNSRKITHHGRAEAVGCCMHHPRLVAIWTRSCNSSLCKASSGAKRRLLRNLCADYQRRGLERIADTVDAVDFGMMCNLSNINAAMRGGMLEVIEVQLMCVGGGPTLDYADAAAFLAAYQPAIDMAMARQFN